MLLFTKELMLSLCRYSAEDEISASFSLIYFGEQLQNVTILIKINLTVV